MLKKKLVKLGILTLGLGSLIVASRPAMATFCCSDCDTLFETCSTNFPNSLHDCTLSYNHCKSTCNPTC
ncbi:MAG TPA: hypothetical protein VGH73_20505 [Thermoanaerobaculia bacterium]|jgi:hypothetical protein